MSEQSYAILVHQPPKGPVNIGDYVQAIAVRNALNLTEFAPLQREGLAEYAGPPVRVVGQGWYCTTDGGWPPAEQIDYLPFAVHISPRGYERFDSPVGLEALKRLSPIGCRDIVTHEWLQKRGIESYFSGCLTLTIQPRDIQRAPDRVYLVDTTDASLRLLPKEYRHLPVERVSHIIEQDSDSPTTHQGWIDLAQQMLDAYYQHGAVVITSRLHALLPSMAMGIPCIWVERRVLDRRLDLARKYAHPHFLPKPDRLPDGLARVTETAVHPALAALQRGWSRRRNALEPRQNMAEVRESILADLRARMTQRGWAS